MLAVLLATVTNISYAVGDIANVYGARSIHPRAMSLLAFGWGLIALLVVTPFMPVPEFMAKPVVVNILLGIISGVSYLLFLKALEVGNAGLVGVVSGSFPALVVLLSVVFFGERIALLQGGALVLILGGLALSMLDIRAIREGRMELGKGVALALVCMIAWAVYFAFIRYPAEAYGWFYSSLITGLVGVLVLVPFSLRAVIELVGAGRGGLRAAAGWPIVNGILGTLASLTYSAAVTMGATSIVAPIAGAYPALYVLLTYYCFRDPLRPLQILGIIIAIVGVITLGLAA